MTLGPRLDQLESRIRECATCCPERAGILLDAVKSVRAYTAEIDARRACELVIAIIDSLEELERLLSIRDASEIDAETAAAYVSKYGSQRAAARALGCSHQTIARRLKVVHGPLASLR